MNLSIYKFPFKVKDYQKISMPKGARILSVQTQNEIPCLWAICEVDAEKQERESEVFGTGNPFYEGIHFGKEHKFIGTFQLHDGSFVGHLFELVDIVD